MDWIPVCDGKDYFRLFEDGTFEIVDEKGGHDSRPE